ncbi:MAG: phosphatidylserine decarboxylase [Pantoea sp. Brub]|nr:phosphatidylserine decarboxylase [Pantoea sp. Brub]
MRRFKHYVILYVLQKNITTLVGYLSNCKLGFLTKLYINIFVWFYKINMHEALEQNISNYLTFNNFFIRYLKKDVRPIDLNINVITAPADGQISQFGNINYNQLIQAKQYYYTLNELLAGDNIMSSKFLNGQFITTYLAPYNYHRVHMPYKGVLREMIYVPGSLYSLSSHNLNKISNIFTKNERVICYFDTDIGPMVQILVGAIIVGSIETVWAGIVTPPHKNKIHKWYYHSLNQNKITLLKGQEMGLFKLGSTVINLFAKKYIKLSKHLQLNDKICVGQPLGNVLHSSIK